MLKGYAGEVGKTAKAVIHQSCECGALFGAEIHTSVNLHTDPELRDDLFSGRLTELACSECQRKTIALEPLVVHDPEIPLLALVVPASLRHKELELRADLLIKLSKDPADVVAYTKFVPVAYGLSQLSSLMEEMRRGDTTNPAVLLDLNQQDEDLKGREDALLAGEEDLLAGEEELITQLAKIEEEVQLQREMRESLERERETLRALGLDLATREEALNRRELLVEPDEGELTEPRIATPDFSQRALSDLDSWRASEEATAHFVVDGRVLLTARPKKLESNWKKEPELLLQYREVGDGQPVVSIICHAKEAPEAFLLWPMNPLTGEDTDRDLLVGLTREFGFQLDVYDEESRVVKTWQLGRPLERNLEEMLKRADETTAGADGVSFSDAVSALDSLGEEILGRKKHNFSDNSFSELPSPASARLALGIIDYWTEAQNEDYLLFVKAFPFKAWRDIQKRVVSAAVDFGLCLSPRLEDVACREDIAKDIPSLWQTTLANFAEVSLRLKPCDLAPGQEWENWQKLIDGCLSRNIEVDRQMEKLAEAAATAARQTRPGLEDESPETLDLEDLPDDDLLPLLAERRQRRDAALELCDRGAHCEAVLSAVMNMTRSEAPRVLAAMVNFGEPAVRVLERGLEHRKSYIRQGAALALGGLKHASANEALVKLLAQEPTRIWIEVARALGDIGESAVPVLLKVIGDSGGEQRERIARALAHIRLANEGVDAVIALEQGNDPTVGKVVTRSIEVMEHVRANDAEVRGGGSKDQTIVRAFTRNFYASLGRDVSELDDEDILEQEELLTDADIVEVQDL